MLLPLHQPVTMTARWEGMRADLGRTLVFIEKMRAHGLCLDPSCRPAELLNTKPRPPSTLAANRLTAGALSLSPSLDRFFREMGSGEEEELESAPQGLHEQRRWHRPEEDGQGGGGGGKWQDMPAELLLRLVEPGGSRTVVMASGVCSAWRAALSESVMELSLSWCGRGVSKLLQSLAPRLRHLVVLSVRRCPSLSDPALAAIAAHCPHLRVLDLSSATRLTDYALTALAHGCRQLEALDLSGCVRVTEAGLVALAASAGGLRVLNVCGCE
eukprot:SM001022S09550  [mRNA]  locus=s1022:374:2235:+ [translate_table: standard]